MNRHHLSATALFLLILAAGSQTWAQSSASVDQRRSQLNKLLDEEWQYEMRDSPMSATEYGDYRYNNLWDDFSVAHEAKSAEAEKQFLARFEAVDTAGFSERDRLNRELMVRQLKDGIEGYRLKAFEMPVNQFWGLQVWLPQFATLVPADSVKHYEDYIARLNAIPAVIDQIIGVLRQGEKDKLMPPKFLLEKVVEQCRSAAEPAGMQNAFVSPLAKFPKEITPADQQRLRDAMIAAVDTKVRPAYRKLADFIETEYAPAGRTQAGIWALPNGDALYRYFVRTRASTNMSPDEIYKLGLAQVAEIEKQETAIALKLGAKDLPSFRESLKTNPKLFPTSREEILDLFQKYVAQMRPQLPKLFGLLPKARVEVVPISRFAEKGADVAEYVPGTPDGSRPGKVYVNTGDYRHRSKIMFEDIAYHEGIPGHHMQMSIAQEIPGLPSFRKHLPANAYVEGWGLYAEELGKEVGFYQDPYSDFGRLNGNLLRAIRLVEDTGVNWKHWTREQMVQYFHAHSGLGDTDIQMEVDRYMVFPGQALAYKIGELKFLELRKRAKKQLGNKFDIRAFHDEMLNAGPLPLDVLDARTNEWIARVKVGSQ